MNWLAALILTAGCTFLFFASAADDSSFVRKVLDVVVTIVLTVVIIACSAYLFFTNGF